MENFKVVGCSEDIAKEFEENLSHFFPKTTPGVSQASVSTLNRETDNIDQDDDIESDDENESESRPTSDHVLKSPLIQSRMRSFVSHSDGSDIDSEHESDGEEEDPIPVVNLLNDSDRSDMRDVESLNTVKAACKKQCLDTFSDKSIIENRLNVQAMDRDSRDMFIMGQLKGCGISRGETTRQGERKRHKFDYQFNNKSICKPCFLFVNNINDRYLKNIRSHILKEGAVPRVHGNVGKKPKHALTYENVQHIVQFLTRYADQVGLPQPAAPRGRDDFPPIYLPGIETKTSVHKTYDAICRETGDRSVSETSFRRIWQRCIPHIQFMTHRTDVCHKCEMFRHQIQKAVTEDDKLSTMADFSNHIHEAQQERDYYNESCKNAVIELKDQPVPQRPVLPASQNLVAVHYTFDFAQSFLLPSHCRQEGGLYFRSPYKANLFGICNDGRSFQTNYVFGEDQCIGIDGNFSHSANSVISMVHDFFENKGEGEKRCILNADNCGGQNKNQIVTSYLAWRVANGLHEDIILHFMKPYHARCMVDGMFGLIRRKFRLTDNDSLSDLKRTIELSSIHNKAVTFSENPWPWRDWKTFLKTTFRAVPGIQQYQHFHFSSAFPGVVKVKINTDGEEKTIRLQKLRKEIPQNLPCRVEVGGHSHDRASYLYKNIRQFVKDPQKDLLCPQPTPDDGVEE